MAKKNNDSLADFDFLDDIAKEFPETPKNTKTEENRVGEGLEKTLKDRKTSPTELPIETKIKQGRPSGYFVQQFPEELKVGSKNIAVYEPIHEQLRDLVYFIDKIHLKEGKDRVSLLGVTVKALQLGMEQLKKEYGIK